MFYKILPKVLVAIMIASAAFVALNYIKDNAVQEYKIEQIEKEVEIRKKVNNAIQENYKLNPSRSGDIALERLCQRYGRTDC